MAPSNHQSLSAGRYLIERLRQLGLGHVFGIPGDYVLGFMHQIEESQLKLIGTTNELCAGYAADAYARIRAGASAVQLYSALVFEGPGLAVRLSRDLAARLRADGFRSLAEAVGAS